jgi:hypothetical protein
VLAPQKVAYPDPTVLMPANWVIAPRGRKGVTVRQPGPDPSVVEIYKLAVEMADRVSSRRSNANAFFLTVQTALVAAAGLAGEPLRHLNSWAALTIALAGAVLSTSWWLLLRSYRELNRAKFAVINELERELPLAIYTSEWVSLREHRVGLSRFRYADLGTVERFVPWVFASIYILLFIGSLVS